MELPCGQCQQLVGTRFFCGERRGACHPFCFCAQRRASAEKLKMQLQLLLCASTLPTALIALEEGLHPSPPPPLWTRKQRLR